MHTTDKNGMAALEEIREAFQRKDVAIWRGGGGVFQNAGLVLAIVSRVPKDKADGMREADADRIRAPCTGGRNQDRGAVEKGRQEVVRALTGAEAQIDRRRGEVKTEYPVMFFLNPMEQEIYHSGWFTVEQLREWAENKGPVMGGRREKRNG